MATLELNLAAKSAYTKQFVNKRRNEMRMWRRQQVMVFTNLNSFKDWLTYTKWYKRPYEIKDSWGGMIQVTFLDLKAPK